MIRAYRLFGSPGFLLCGGTRLSAWASYAQHGVRLIGRCAWSSSQTIPACKLVLGCQLVFLRPGSRVSQANATSASLPCLSLAQPRIRQTVIALLHGLFPRKKSRGKSKMKKIKLLQNSNVDGVDHVVGDIVELDAAAANALIATGIAEEVTDDPARETTATPATPATPAAPAATARSANPPAAPASAAREIPAVATREAVAARENARAFREIMGRAGYVHTMREFAPEALRCAANQSLWGRIASKPSSNPLGAPIIDVDITTGISPKADCETNSEDSPDVSARLWEIIDGTVELCREDVEDYSELEGIVSDALRTRAAITLGRRVAYNTNAASVGLRPVVGDTAHCTAVAVTGAMSSGNIVTRLDSVKNALNPELTGCLDPVILVSVSVLNLIREAFNALSGQTRWDNATQSIDGVPVIVSSSLPAASPIAALYAGAYSARVYRDVTIISQQSENPGNVKVNVSARVVGSLTGSQTGAYLVIS